MTGSTYAFTVSRHFKQDRETVFAAFSDAASIAQWFKPSAEITIEVLTFEFSENGKYRLRYTMPDETRPILFGTYKIISPPDKLVFTWGWEEPDPHAGIPSIVSIQLLAKGDSTELVVTHEGTASTQIAAGHVVGWEGALDCLERLLSAKELS